VGEGLVGLGHLVGVFATLHSGTETVRGVQNLVHETLGHGLLAAGLGVANQPAQSQSRGTARLDLNGNLVRGATDTAGADLKGRPDIVHGLLQSGNGVAADLGLDTVKSTVNDALCGGLLAVDQNLVDQLGNQRGTVDGIYN
jgi:hypothetical protein